MKVALVQITSQAGDIETGLARHLAALQVLRPGDAELAVFPELSLGGYEPQLAAATATGADDRRLDALDAFATRHGIAILAGLPLATEAMPGIAALLFTPGGPRRVIRKAYLHSDEQAWFEPGSSEAVVLDLAWRVGIAICHDINVDAHLEQLVKKRIASYIASVAKTAEGMEAARRRLADIAREHAIPALIVNCTGYCEGEPAGGGSLMIDRRGNRVAGLDRNQQACLICDLEHTTAETRPVPG